MRRREFIALIGGATAAWPIAPRAQQPARLPQVAILRGEVAGDPEGLRNSAALLPLTLSLSDFGIYFYPWARQRRPPNTISF